VQQCDQIWRKFCRHLEANHLDEQIRGLISIRPEDLDTFDLSGKYNEISFIVNVLRKIRESNSNLLGKDTCTCLNFKSHHKAKMHVPREPLSEFVNNELVAACDKRVAEIRDRVLTGQEYYQRLLNRPERTKAEEIFTQIAQGHRFSVSRRKPLKQSDVPYSTWDELAASVALTTVDTAAFIFALGLRVEMPIECIRDLRRDCLKNDARGFVDIEYVKGRGGQDAVQKTERVRDGGLKTPGGIIRLALALTEHASKVVETYDPVSSQALWIGAHRRGGTSFRPMIHNSREVTALVQSLKIADDSGHPITTIDCTRLRKTVKMHRYRRYGGHLGRFASDNSQSIAVRHYANLDATREDHANAVVDAQNRLFLSAMEPVVLPR
jgi:hypothetical protein